MTSGSPWRRSSSSGRSTASRAAIAGSTPLDLGQVYPDLGAARRAPSGSWRRARDAAVRSRDATRGLRAALQIDALLCDAGRPPRARPRDRRQIRARGVELDRRAGGRQMAPRAVATSAHLSRLERTRRWRAFRRPEHLFVTAESSPASAPSAWPTAGELEEAPEILRRMMAARDMGSNEDRTSAAVLRYLLEAAVLLRRLGARRGW